MGQELEFVARIEKGKLDALLYISDQHQVTVWTYVFPERVEIVGIEARSRDQREQIDLQTNWLKKRVREFESSLEGDPAPLPASLLRTEVSFRRILKDRATAIAMNDNSKFDVGVVSATGEHIGGLNAEDHRMLEPLLDAQMYVQAASTGASPAESIAKYRQVSRRTAEGRIAKARALGLLSSASGRRVGGQLTPLAEEIAARVEAMGRAVKSGPGRG